jgi:hypothetical protein
VGPTSLLGYSITIQWSSFDLLESSSLRNVVQERIPPAATKHQHILVSSFYVSLFSFFLHLLSFFSFIHLLSLFDLLVPLFSTTIASSSFLYYFSSDFDSFYASNFFFFFFFCSPRFILILYPSFLLRSTSPPKNYFVISICPSVNFFFLLGFELITPHVLAGLTMCVNESQGVVPPKYFLI